MNVPPTFESYLLFDGEKRITKEQDTVKGGSFNPKQRRNAGDPPTEAIEGQMGTEVGALYGNMKLK